MSMDKEREMEREIVTDANFSSSFNELLPLFLDPDYDKKDVGIFSKILPEIFNKNRWGRRKALAFIHHVFDALNKSENDTYNAVGDLNEFTTALEGDCDIDFIYKFPNDPVDNEILGVYVRSRKWLDEDFYTSTL